MDIDDLSARIRDGHDPAWDLDNRGTVDSHDRAIWIHEVQKTYFGDANLDGEFNSADLIGALAAGTYEVELDAGWASGDFDGNGRFDSSDLVEALADSGYEQGLHPPAMAAVPEPKTCLLLGIGLVVASFAQRTRVTFFAAWL
jgi:hypothetical protein